MYVYNTSICNFQILLCYWIHFFLIIYICEILIWDLGVIFGHVWISWYRLYYSFCVSYMLVLDSHWSERMYTQLLHCKFISHNLCSLFRIEWGGLTTVVGSSVPWWFEKPNPWFQNVYLQNEIQGRTKTHRCNIHCIILIKIFMFFLLSQNHVVRFGWNCY